MEEDDDRLYSVEEVFPAFHVGHALRGLRLREQLTQKQLANMIGAKPSHISEMEHGDLLVKTWQSGWRRP